jgi:hypothetical protein
VIRRLAAIAVLLPGCAALSEQHMMDRKVTKLEQEQPDAEALRRDDLASTNRVLGWMESWKERVANDTSLTPVERAKLIDRLDAAQRRYKIAGAQVAAPNTAFSLARPFLTPEDPALLPLIRRTVDALAADRQRRFAKSHTYFYDSEGQYKMEMTESSISYERGHVVNRYEEHERVETPGRCVLATDPFGPEGTPNPTLTFHIVGAAPRLYGRCYVRHSPNDFADAGDLRITVGGAHARVIDYRGLREKQPFFDFAVQQGKDGHIVDPGKPFADLPINVNFTYYDGVVIGIDHQGDLRPANQFKVAHLAAGQVFWDRDGDAVSSK